MAALTESHESSACRTLFVRNLPFETKNEDLEGLFGEIGPVKRCFVIKNKEDDNNGCKGYGYVTYSMIEDASTALKKIKTFKNRKLFLSYSDKRSKRESQKIGKSNEVIKDGTKSARPEIDNTKVRDLTIDKSRQKKRNQMKFPLADLELTNLPVGTSQKSLEKYLRKIKNIDSVVFPVHRDSGLCATVHFEHKAGAKNALKTLEARKLQGHDVGVVLKEVGNRERQVAANLEKTVESVHGIVIRNLSFQCNEDRVRKEFKRFGEVSRVYIPKKPDGKKLGCAFVDFHNKTDAAKAIEHMNGSELKGRRVAVDWALGKKEYSNLSQDTSTREKKVDSKAVKSHRNVSRESDESEDDEDSDGSDNDESDGEENEEDNVKAMNKIVKRIESEDEENADESNEDEPESDDDDESEGEQLSDSDEEEQSHKTVARKNFEEESDVDSDEKQDSDETLSSIDDDEEGTSHKKTFLKRKYEEEFDEKNQSSEDTDTEDDPSSKKKKKKTRKRNEGPSDVEEGKTLFIRNLSYDTEEEDLEEMMIEFGEIEYCRIVMDKNTDHSKGVAFVKFADKESTQKCLDKANDESKKGGLTLDKRKLSVVMAVDKIKAKELAKPKKNEKEDKRNLHLVREGMVRPGTQAAEGVSQLDLEKRMRGEKVKRAKLKNPSIFVSALRLCVQNIPTKIDDQALKKLFLRAVGDQKAKVTECRIMRDLQRVNAAGVGKSRGYGFIAFAEHEHALKALRNTNNKPDIFEPNKRPIVEFSLENSSALEAKRRRLERFSGEKTQKRAEKLSTLAPAPTDAEGKKLKVRKGLPSHWGPKIRHNRPKPQKIPNKPKGKLSRTQTVAKSEKNDQHENTVSADHGVAKPKKHKNRGKKRKQESDDFDKLVSNYKTKIQNVKKAKWFD